MNRLIEIICAAVVGGCLVGSIVQRLGAQAPVPRAPIHVDFRPAPIRITYQVANRTLPPAEAAIKPTWRRAGAVTLPDDTYSPEFAHDAHALGLGAEELRGLVARLRRER